MSDKENIMVKLPAKVRKEIYVTTALTSPVLAYLNQSGVVNEFWFGLYAVVVTAVTSLAALNVSEK